MMPSIDKVQKVAEHFNVSIDCLIGRDYKESTVAEEPEMLRKDKRYGVLLSASQKLTMDDLDAVIRIVEKMGEDD